MGEKPARMATALVAGSLASALILLGCADLEQAETAADEARNADSVAAEVRPESADTALEVEYDRFENHSRIASPLIKGDPYHVKASYECDGSPRCRPDNVAISLTPDESTRDSLQARNEARDQEDNPFAAFDTVAGGSPVSGHLIFLVDGEKRYKVDDRAWDASRKRQEALEEPVLGRRTDRIGTYGSMDEDELMDQPDWGLRETGIGAIRARVPFHVFRSIARGNRVEFRLNGYEAALTARQLTVLRRMANLVQDAR